MKFSLKPYISLFIVLTFCVLGFSGCKKEGEMLSLENDGNFKYGIYEDRVEIVGYLGSGGNVVLPTVYDEQTITVVSDRAFFGNTNITSISIPEGYTKLGSEAFSNCIRLNAIQFPLSLSEIGKDAFSFCTALESVILPENLKSIPDNMFYRCRESAIWRFSVARF